MSFRRTVSFPAHDSQVRLRDGRLIVDLGVEKRMYLIIRQLHAGESLTANQIAELIDPSYARLHNHVHYALRRLVNHGVIRKDRTLYRLRRNGVDIWNNNVRDSPRYHIPALRRLAA